MRKKITKKQRKEATRFVEYMIGGGVWFWSGYVIIVVLDGHIGLFWANVLGQTVGLSLNFLIERYWAFKTKRPAALLVATKRYIVYTIVNAFGLNYLILLGLRNVGIDPAIGQFIASAFFTVWNYYWYKVYVFKGKEKPRHIKHHTP
jgi:putative flippase GtrA